MNDTDVSETRSDDVQESLLDLEGLNHLDRQTGEETESAKVDLLLETAL